MSLINDALKRAQADKSTTGDPSSSLPHPDRPGQPASGGARKRLAIVILLAAGIGAGAWYFLQGSRPGTPKKATADVVKPAAAKATKTARSAATKPAPNVSPEIREIIEKSVAAVNYYRPPAPDLLSPAELVTSLGPTAPEAAPEAEAAPPAEEPKPSAQTKPAPAPQTQPARTPGVAKPAAPTFDPSRYRVSGVLTDGDGGAAVINGRIVRVGEAVDGAKVVSISGRTVRVEFAGKEYVLGT